MYFELRVMFLVLDGMLSLDFVLLLDRLLWLFGWF